MVTADRSLFLLRHGRGGVPDPFIGLAVLWAGLMCGFFYAFSVLVMPGLRETDQLNALESMQEINRAVDGNTLFGIGFFGAALLLFANAVFALVSGRDRANLLTIAGSLVYLIGVFGVTVAFNVPMNDDLDLLDPGDPANRSKMETYIDDWSMWNDVRTAASLVAFVLLLLAFHWRRRDRAKNGQAA